MAKMKTWCESEGYRNLVILIARIIVGVIFVLAGWSKLAAVPDVALKFADWGFPTPEFFVWVTGLVELVGGAAIALGIMTRLWSMILAVVMLVALFAVHIPQGHPFADAMRLPLSLFAAMLVLSSTGGGCYRLWSKNCPLS